MSKSSKLIDRFLSKPKDLTWDELVKVFEFYGYLEKKKGKTGGSRRKFINEELDVISLHKPHPSNIVKMYAINEVIANLKEKGKIKDE